MSLPALSTTSHSHSEAEPFISVEDLPTSIRGHRSGAYTPPTPPNPIKPLDELLTDVESRLIETALSQARGNKSRAAELLGISRPRLYRRIKELNLPDDELTDENDADTEKTPSHPCSEASRQCGEQLSTPIPYKTVSCAEKNRQG